MGRRAAVVGNRGRGQGSAMSRPGLTAPQPGSPHVRCGAWHGQRRRLGVVHLPVNNTSMPMAAAEGRHPRIDRHAERGARAKANGGNAGIAMANTRVR